MAPAVATLLVAASLAGCARTDSTAGRAASASGDVASPASSVSNGPLSDSVSTRADAGRIRGSDKATVWLVEISDFQCPYCRKWHDESFAALDREYVQTGKVRLAYLNYPLSSIHPNAQAASEAAMCASVQGKFWPLHESLFASQPRWEKLGDPLPVFDSLATAAGAAMPAWRACMTTHATAPLIQADLARSSANGVASTPTFFVGSTRIEGAYPLDTFRVVLNSALARSPR